MAEDSTSVSGGKVSTLYRPGETIVFKYEGNVRAEVTIHGRYRLAPIDIQPNQWLPAEQATIVRVPLVIPWQVVPPIVEETLGSPTITYRVQGSADVTAIRMLGIERDNYPLDEQGSVRRQDLVNAAAGMLR